MGPGKGGVGLVRTLIVSDVRVYRDGLTAALRADPVITVVGVAAHPNEATHRVAEASPTVALMDARMPDGAAVVRALRSVDDRLQIVGLSAHDGLIPACLDAGMDDFLPPEASVSEIRDRLAALPDGRSDDVGGEPESADGATPFTRRELQVLALLRRGQTNKEIAASLFIAESTAKNHVHSILQKARVRRRAQVVAWTERSAS